MSPTPPYARNCGADSGLTAVPRKKRVRCQFVSKEVQFFVGYGTVSSADTLPIVHSLLAR